MSSTAITEILGVETSSCVALIGAGGKTTILLAMASELAHRGLGTAVTTTTKMWPPPSIPLHLWEDPDRPLVLLDPAVSGPSLVAVAGSVGPEGKLYGLAPEHVSRLLGVRGIQVVLCEADGAAGRSVKAHATHEPVVPSRSSHVLIVSGLDAIGKPVESAAHRTERFCELTAALPDSAVTPRHMARALQAATAFAPSGARVAILLNKADSPARLDQARDVVNHLRDAGVMHDVLATCRGRVVDRFPSLYSW